MSVVSTPEQPVGESGVVRVASWVIGLLLGVVFGMLGTVVHQSTISFFGLFDLPIGLILAVAAVLFLLVGLRLILPSRLLAFLAALGLVGIVAVLTLPSPGGSILIPADEANYGYIWTFAPTVIAIVVLAWPKLSRRGVAPAPSAGPAEQPVAGPAEQPVAGPAEQPADAR